MSVCRSHDEIWDGKECINERYTKNIKEHQRDGRYNLTYLLLSARVCCTVFDSFGNNPLFHNYKQVFTGHHRDQSHHKPTYLTRYGVIR